MSEQQERMNQLLEAKRASIRRSQQEIERMERELDLQKQKLQFFKQIQTLAGQNHRKLKSEFEYEELDEYWNLMHKMAVIENEIKFMGLDDQINKSQQTINMNKEEVARLNAELDE